MSTRVKPCPLCDAEAIKVSMHPTRDAFDIECRRCGPFTISGTLYAISKFPPELKPQLSAYTRQCKEDGQYPEMFSTYNLESIAQRVGTIPPDKKPDKLLAVVAALTTRRLRVWYDRMVLTIGDSLRRKIDEGLAKSRFGIVILSKAFFGKGWPERELDGLVQKEVSGQKVILPVWDGVTHADVAQYSLPLADRLAGSTDQGVETLADELVRAIKEGVSSVQERTTAKSFPSTAAAPMEKWVDIHCPRDSGLLRRLETEGYKAKWCFDRDVARAVDIEGWELVYLDSGEGQQAILRLRDRPDNQTLLKKRQP